MQMQIQFGDVEHIQDIIPLSVAEPLALANCQDPETREATGVDTSPETVGSPDFDIKEMVFDQATGLSQSASKDNCIRNLLTARQAVHDTSARTAGKAFWRSAKDRKEREDELGRGKFEICAYMQTESVQNLDTPGMGLELECLTSFLSAAHSKNIINGYVAGKKQNNSVTRNVAVMPKLICSDTIGAPQIQYIA